MEPTEIASRARKLRLSHVELARRAKVTPETISRFLNDRQQPYHLTRTSVTAAIVAEELALRDYLVALHGVPPGKERAA